MFYYLYKITNTQNNKIYIGVHQTKNLDDEYFGSGLNLHRAIKKYSKEHFVKEILEYFDNEESMLAREKELVNSEFVKSTDTYNINEGGKGSFSYINSLPNQNHKPGQQKAASMLGHQAFRDKLANDPEFATYISHIRSTYMKQSFEDGTRINPATYHKWISNDSLLKSIYVPKDKIEELSKDGWYLGRKYKKTNLGKKHKKRI